MQFHVLATDFDGTIAEHGVVPQSTLNALQRIKDSGRKLILITGRRLEPLAELLPDLSLFHYIVAENGVLLFQPESGQEKLLAQAPPVELLTKLQERGVNRLEHGRVIVATWRPFETIALDVISELAIDLQIIFNKDAVMLLPSGCNKALGLKAALKELQISALNTICVGDAENDEAMMRMVGCSVAVANALEPVKELCDYVTSQPRGSGVEELCEMILKDDLQSLHLHVEHSIPLGQLLDGTLLTIPMTGQNVFVTGGPGGGKSKFAMHFLEQLTKLGGQACIIDPEGDYQGIDASITLGSAERAPAVDEVINLVEQPGKHCIVSLFAVQKKERAEYFNRLLHGLVELRSRTARPHWIVIDEAHYAAPVESHFAEKWNPSDLKAMLFITAFDDHVSKCLLEQMDLVVSISDTPMKEIQDLAKELNEEVPSLGSASDSEMHRAIAWNRREQSITWFHRLEADSENQRHKHSLLEGELDPDQHFIFRGPEQKLNLKAINLRRFMEIAEGIDDSTWLFHLQRHDYSTWFDHVVKDSILAQQVRNLETQFGDDPQMTRAKIIDLIKEHFDAKW